MACAKFTFFHSFFMKFFHNIFFDSQSLFLFKNLKFVYNKDSTVLLCFVVIVESKLLFLKLAKLLHIRFIQLLFMTRLD